MTIYPSILTESLSEAQTQVNKIKDLPEGLLADPTIQFDIIDGFFADNLTITPLDLVNLDLEGIRSDLHLMVEEPLDFVYELIDVESEVEVRAVIAQIERMTAPSHFIEEVKAHGWLAGLSWDLHTPISEIDDRIWPLLDIVQVMSIEAGFQGQKFEPQALKKIAAVRDMRAALGLDFELIVDGGIKEAQIKEVEELGTNGVTIGSALWKSPDLPQTLAGFTALMED